MSKPIKIFELKGQDFAKGYSYFSDFPFGGNMSQIVNFDPFLDYGYFTPSLGSAVTDSSLTSTPRFLTTWNSSGTARMYAHTKTKLYSILNGTPWTTTDVSAQIDVTNEITGATIFQNKYIYAHAQATKIFANAFPVALGSNVTILDSGGSNTDNYTPMCVAADKNLYVGIGDIGRITVTNALNNGAYYALEAGTYCRDLANDGHYLIVIADNNTSHSRTTDGVTGTYRCQVSFYDVNNGRSTPDFKYEFTDSYVSAVKVLDGKVYIFGKDNLWVCNSQTPPTAIFNFQAGSTITEPPKHFFQVHQRNNVIYWIGQTNAKIYAFGSKVAGAKKVFFQPFNTGAQPTCMTTSGNTVYIGSDGNNSMVYVLDSNQTKQTATIGTSYFNLEQPYTFAFAKVIMKNKLATGGSISLGMNSLAGEITDYTTKVFSTVGAKQSIIFNKASDAGNPPVANFNDFNVTVVSNQAVSKVEIWAYPVENYDQTV